MLHVRPRLERSGERLLRCVHCSLTVAGEREPTRDQSSVVLAEEAVELDGWPHRAVEGGGFTWSQTSGADEGVAAQRQALLRRYSPRPFAWASKAVLLATPSPSRPTITKFNALMFGSA